MYNGNKFSSIYIIYYSFQYKKQKKNSIFFCGLWKNIWRKIFVCFKKFIFKQWWKINVQNKTNTLDGRKIAFYPITLEGNYIIRNVYIVSIYCLRYRSLYTLHSYDIPRDSSERKHLTKSSFFNLLPLKKICYLFIWDLKYNLLLFLFGTVSSTFIFVSIGNSNFEYNSIWMIFIYLQFDSNTLTHTRLDVMTSNIYKINFIYKNICISESIWIDYFDKGLRLFAFSKKYLQLFKS